MANKEFLIMEKEKPTFKKVWGIPETEDRFISLVYDYAPKAK
jgi:hypothetical protein